MQIQINEARLLFEAGSLKTCHITRAINQPGWMLTLTDKQRKSYALSAQREPIRVFKTLETAAKAAHDIGFADLSVNLL